MDRLFSLVNRNASGLLLPSSMGDGIVGVDKLAWGRESCQSCYEGSVRIENWACRRRHHYKLSLRDLGEMLIERGFVFTHEAVREWAARFAPLLAERLRAKYPAQADCTWYVDPTYSKAHGRWCYLYLAIDRDGNDDADGVVSNLSNERDGPESPILPLAVSILTLPRHR